MKSKCPLYFMVLLVVCAWLSPPVTAVTLVVEGASGSVGQLLRVPVVVDDPAAVSGASFTLQYSDSLSVTVDSTFFDTLYNQFDALANTGEAVLDGNDWKFPLLDASGNPVLDEGNNPVYLVTGVEVGGSIYTQPVLDNLTREGTNILHHVSGTRCKPAAADEDATVFTLSVALKPDRPAGTYAIHIVPTTVSNTDAGYAPAGETINLLIGSDTSQPVGSPGAFPVLLAADGYDAHVVSGQVEFIANTSDDWHLDIDGNGKVTALTDGLLMMRHLMGFDAEAGWTVGFRDPAASNTETDIDAFLASGASLSALDIDGNGSVSYLTDGILVMRYLLGFYMTGPGWTQGFRDAAATKDEAQIEAGIRSLIRQ